MGGVTQAKSEIYLGVFWNVRPTREHSSWTASSLLSARLSRETIMRTGCLPWVLRVLLYDMVEVIWSQSVPPSRGSGSPSTTPAFSGIRRQLVEMQTTRLCNEDPDAILIHLHVCRRMCVCVCQYVSVCVSVVCVCVCVGVCLLVVVYMCLWKCVCVCVSIYLCVCL